MNKTFFEVKSPVQRTRHCWMLHVPSVYTPCCMLLLVVWSCCAKFETNNTLHFFCSVTAEAWRKNLGSLCTALPTFLGPRTCQDGCRMQFYKVGWVVPFPRRIAGPSKSCCIRLHMLSLLCRNRRGTTKPRRSIFRSGQRRSTFICFREHL